MLDCLAPGWPGAEPAEPSQPSGDEGGPANPRAVSHRREGRPRVLAAAWPELASDTGPCPGALLALSNAPWQAPTVQS